jgi:O-antigen/teichoic acid export membrane protein
MLLNLFNYLFFSVLGSAIGFLTTVYLARTVSQESMGIVGLFAAFLFVAPQIVSFASSGLISINKVGFTKEKYQKFSGVYITFGLLNFSFIFLLALSLTFVYKEYLVLFLAVPLVSLLMFLSSFHQSELVIEGKSRAYGLYNLALILGSSLFTVVFVSVIGLSWEGRVLGVLVGQISILLLMNFFTFQSLRQLKFEFNILKFIEFYTFGLPLFAGLAAGWILNQADNYIVLAFFSLKDVGLYAVAYSIGAAVNTVNQSATNAILPILYQALKEKRGRKLVRKLNIYYSVFILLLSLIVGLGSFWYVPLLFGVEYASSSIIVFFIALAFGFNGIYRTTNCVIAYYKRNSLQMKLVYVSAVINILMSLALISTIGLVAPAVGTLVAYIFLAFSCYYFGWKVLQEEELS